MSMHLPALRTPRHICICIDKLSVDRQVSIGSLLVARLIKASAFRCQVDATVVLSGRLLIVVMLMQPSRRQSVCLSLSG